MMLYQQVNDPILALKHHILSNNLTSDNPLCSYILRHKQHSHPPNTTKIPITLQQDLVFSRPDCHHHTGHAFQIRGTTHLLLSCVPTHIVKVMGCWSSDEFLKYWRSLKIIAPLLFVTVTGAHYTGTRRLHYTHVS